MFERFLLWFIGPNYGPIIIFGTIFLLLAIFVFGFALEVYEDNVSTILSETMHKLERRRKKL